MAPDFFKFFFNQISRCYILDIKKIGTDKEFLKSGGSSLSIMSLISEIYQDFEIEMPIHEIFSRPTIGKLADFIREETSEYNKNSSDYSNEKKESDIKISKISEELILREFEITDYNGISELNQDSFNYARSKEYWQFIWENNPGFYIDNKKIHLPKGWVLENTNKDIVGFIGNITFSYNFKGKKLLAAIASGWVVKKEYRKYSLYLLEKYWSQNNVDIFITNTANEIAYKSFISTGAKILPTNCYTESLIFITDYKKTLKDISIKNNLPTMLVSPASISLKTFDFIRGKIKTSQNINVKTYENNYFDKRFNKLWKQLIDNNSNLLIADRDINWLNWHYKYSFNIKDIWIFYIEKNNILTSYAIFKIREKPSINQKFIQLIDIEDIDNNPDNILALVSKGILKCRSEKISYLKILGFSKFKREIISTLNPYYKKHDWSVFLYKANNKELEQELLNEDIWDVGPYDGDETI